MHPARPDSKTRAQSAHNLTSNDVERRRRTSKYVEGRLGPGISPFVCRTATIWACRSRSTFSFLLSCLTRERLVEVGRTLWCLADAAPQARRTDGGAMVRLVDLNDDSQGRNLEMPCGCRAGRADPPQPRVSGASRLAGWLGQTTHVSSPPPPLDPSLNPFPANASRRRYLSAPDHTMEICARLGFETSWKRAPAPRRGASR